MGEYFHGWRRKAGCATLVMAFGLFGVWCKSHFTIVHLGFGHYSHCSLEIGQGELRFERIRQVRVDTQTQALTVDRLGPEHGWTWQTVQFSSFGWEADRQPPSEDATTYAAPGIEVWCTTTSVDDDSTRITDNYTFLQVSLWWLISPLTLLSAWLLLSKPRSGKTTDAQQGTWK